ncbi:MAG: DUF2225 domain-containing protein [Treponema sp.]|nr:DUF2225 domain-containing protein [Treponema sp.]
MSGEDKELKISFISKKEFTCPSCDTTFRKEEMLSGGGRLIAGALTEELHRLYEPSLKYGEVYPLSYQAVVCPVCWFASMEADFPVLPNTGRGKALRDKNRRMEETQLIFPSANFNRPRTLMEGAASQYLVLSCYDYYEKASSPTIKQGLASLRTAWLLDELNKKFPQQHYDWLALLFRKKAKYFYNEALDREQSGRETMSGIKSFGPDTDKNYSYEGMLYLCAYLRYKYGPSQESMDRRKSLEDARRTIAKLFGMGKSSKDKPGAFLELARKVYDAINKELENK